MKTRWSAFKAAFVDASQWWDRVSLLSAAERRKLLVEWNDTAAPYASGQCIHELFEEQASRSPQAVALAFKDTYLSYGELNARANRLAHHLRTLGVGPEVLTAIYLDRCPDTVVAILAILKAGGAYVPLDATYPRDRLSLILEDACAPVMVTHEHLVAQLPGYRGEIVCPERDSHLIENAPAQNPSKVARDENTAFALFTSGSTGRPKGVLVTHGNLVNYRLLWERECALSENVTALCQMAFFSFAVFQGDVVRALCSGKKLVLCPRETLLSPRILYELMRREGVDFAEFVPELLRSLFGYLRESGQNLDFMRVLVVGSDRWYMRDHQEVRHYCGAHTRFLHVYGSSETTLDSTRFEHTDLVLPANQLAPIGRPFTNVQAYVLDTNLQPVPIGVEGELYIGGAGVARGYLNRPELTAERFSPDLFRQEVGARLFRTGDLARYLPDGNLAFLGRRDHQVKIRGFRIELGEVEAAVAQHPHVTSAVAQAVKIASGAERLAVYYVAHHPVPGTEELRHFTARKLPDFMVPAYFVALEALPLTPSGKIDRLALPHPERKVQQPKEEDRGSGEIERTLLLICGHAVGRQRLGREDNLFAAAADSMAIVGIVTGTENTFGVSIEEDAINPEVFASVATLSAYVEKRLQEKITRTGPSLESSASLDLAIPGVKSYGRLPPSRAE